MYFTINDKDDPAPTPADIDITYNLYFSDYPYSKAAAEFDENLGDHDGFRLVGRYIFAQRTDDGVISLYVSDKRKPFKKAMIPVPDEHQKYVHCIYTMMKLIINTMFQCM